MPPPAARRRRDEGARVRVVGGGFARGRLRRRGTGAGFRCHRPRFAAVGGRIEKRIKRRSEKRIVKRAVERARERAHGGGGGFYLDDGPPAVSSADLAAIPDAAPRAEPILAARNRPYSALGQNFSPMTELRPYRRRGLASWYGRRYHGRKTSLGETYDMFKMTAAHPTLPLPSYARVTRVDAPDKTVVVRVNDRGPFLRGRIIDLSYAAAAKLGIVKNGVGAVEVELLLPPFADDSPRPSAAARRRCAAARRRFRCRSRRFARVAVGGFIRSGFGAPFARFGGGTFARARNRQSGSHRCRKRIF